MFCPKCGTKAIEGAEFCQKCGAKLIVDNPVEQPVETPQSNPVQQSAPASINATGKKKSKLPIISGVAALAIIFIILAVIGSKSGSSTSDNPPPDDIDAATSETPNKSEPLENPTDLSTTDEVLYAGIPVSQLLGASYSEVIDLLGNPSSEGSASIQYEGINMYFSGDDHTVNDISGDGQFFTMNGQTLDKGYDEFIQMFGEPDFEPDSRYSQVLWYDTNKYQMNVLIDWETGDVSIDFMPPSNDDGGDDYGGGAGYNDYSNPVDLSLVGRWRAYDGGYVELDEYGNAAVSLSLTPSGSLLLNPDYVTWEGYNGRIILSSHYSETSTYEITDLNSGQRLDLSANKYSGRYYTRVEAGSSLVGTWDMVGRSGSNSLVLLSDGTGMMNRVISTSSMGDVPITWWADDTELRIDWSLQSAYDYTVSGNVLTIYVSNGSKVYQRVGN